MISIAMMPPNSLQWEHCSCFLPVVQLAPVIGARSPWLACMVKAAVPALSFWSLKDPSATAAQVRYLLPSAMAFPSSDGRCTSSSRYIFRSQSWRTFSCIPCGTVDVVMLSSKGSSFGWAFLKVVRFSMVYPSPSSVPWSITDIASPTVDGNSWIIFAR